MGRYQEGAWWHGVVVATDCASWGTQQHCKALQTGCGWVDTHTPLATVESQIVLSACTTRSVLIAPPWAVKPKPPWQPKRHPINVRCAPSRPTLQHPRLLWLFMSNTRVTGVATILNTDPPLNPTTQTHKHTWASFVISTLVSASPCPRPGYPLCRNPHTVNPCKVQPPACPLTHPAPPELGRCPPNGWVDSPRTLLLPTFL